MGNSKAIKLILWISAAVLVLALSAIFLKVASNAPKSEPGAAAAGTVDVAVTTAALSQPGSAVEYSGKVKSKDTVDILSSVSGKVVGVNVREGQKVKAGGVLFTVDATKSSGATVTSEKAQLDSATAARKTGSANISRLKKYIQETDRQIASIGSKISSAQKQLQTAEKSAAGGAASTSSAIAALHAQISRYGSDLLNAKNAKTQLSTKLSAEVKKQKTLDTRYAQAKKSYDESQKSLAKTPVAAEGDGVMDAVLAKPGDTVKKGAALGAVSASGQIYISCEAPQQAGRKIKLGDSATANIKAVQAKAFSGRVASITATQGGAGTYTVSISLSNASDAIQPGMDAQVKIDVSGGDEIIEVPISALISHNGEDAVVLIRGGSPFFSPVVTGRTNGSLIEIKSGVSVGDEVVYMGQGRLTEKSKINIINQE